MMIGITGIITISALFRGLQAESERRLRVGEPDVTVRLFRADESLVKSVVERLEALPEVAMARPVAVAFVEIRIAAQGTRGLPAISQRAAIFGADADALDGVLDLRGVFRHGTRPYENTDTGTLRPLPVLVGSRSLETDLSRADVRSWGALDRGDRLVLTVLRDDGELQLVHAVVADVFRSQTIGDYLTAPLSPGRKTPRNHPARNPRASLSPPSDAG